MRESLTLAPPNSLVLVMDYGAGELPERITEELVVATASCLAIGTLSAADGDTRITLTDSLRDIEHAGLVFEGSLLTPNHEISICNVRNEKLMTMPVSNERTRVLVFANDPVEPNEIVVICDSEFGA